MRTASQPASYAKLRWLAVLQSTVLCVRFFVVAVAVAAADRRPFGRL